MVELSRQYLEELWKEINERIKDKLNKRFSSSDERAFASYLLVYFAIREYPVLYNDRSPKGISGTEREKMKELTINYLSNYDNKELKKWAIDYLSNDEPIMILDNFNRPTKYVAFYKGEQI